MALTQPLRAWQLEDDDGTLWSPGVLLCSMLALALLSWPSGAHAQFDEDPMNRSTSLDEFPHDVVLVDDGRFPDGLSTEVLTGDIQDAIDAWNEVSCSYAELRWAGVVGDATNFDESTTPIVFANPDDERCFAADTNIGWTVINPCCSRRNDEDECVGRAYPAYTIFLNTRDYEWDTRPAPYQDGSPLRVDVRSVVTHELGHVLGLTHTADDTLATMAPRYLRDGGLYTLASVDKQELCSRYPQEADECAVDSDCPDHDACVDTGSWRVCDEYRGRIGEHCALDELICPGTCHVSSPSTFSGYCTETCSADQDCPGDFICDTDEQECRLIVRAHEDTACSTGNARGASGSLLLAVLLLFTSRRLSRGGSRSRRSRVLFDRGRTSR